MMTVPAAPDGASREGHALVDALRIKHATQIQKAPDSATSAILQSGLDLLKAVQQRETEALCAKVAYAGGVALDPDDRFYQDFFDKEGTAAFRAIGAGLRNPASPRKATDADWIRVAKRYPGTRQQYQLAVDGNAKAPGYCKAVILLYEMVLDARGPSARRVRANLAYLLSSE